MTEMVWYKLALQKHQQLAEEAERLRALIWTHTGYLVVIYSGLGSFLITRGSLPLHLICILIAVVTLGTGLHTFILTYNQQRIVTARQTYNSISEILLDSGDDHPKRELLLKLLQLDSGDNRTDQKLLLELLQFARKPVRACEAFCNQTRGVFITIAFVVIGWLIGGAIITTILFSIVRE